MTAGWGGEGVGGGDGRRKLKNKILEQFQSGG